MSTSESIGLAFCHELYGKNRNYYPDEWAWRAMSLRSGDIFGEVRKS
jgi:hypothetical protein